MKIIYAQNPLNTVIELNEYEKKELYYIIKIKEYEERLYDAFYYHSHDKNEENLKKAIDPEYYSPENDDKPSPMDERCKRLHEYLLSELSSGHVGDCTCVPCSCGKCMAEDYLGINTIKGLGKYRANQIDNVFREIKTNNIDDAIESLRNYKVVIKDPAAWEARGGYEQYVPRWEKEAREAMEWLINYKNEFLVCNEVEQELNNPGPHRYKL